ncbi:MAG: hypothetical protein Kow002_01600 [Anaerolineales bacterium]
MPIVALVFYLWNDRSLKGLLSSLGIASGVLALTSPWWGLIVSRHGLAPFIASLSAAGQDSFNALVGLFIFFRFMFTDEALLPILAVLGLLGLFVTLAHKRTLLPAWFFIIHLIEPRGGTLYMMIPLALMAGYALEKVILPGMQTETEKSRSPENFQRKLEQVLGGKVTRYFVLFVFAYGMMSAYSTGQKIKDEFSLQPADLEAFAWVQANTATDSQFTLITGQLPLRDAWSEWFPVLAQRRSAASVFGYEWVHDGNFGTRVEAYKALQACATQDTACIEKWRQAHETQFSYLLLRDRSDPQQMPLSIYLKQDPGYELVFENDETLIFRLQEDD